MMALFVGFVQVWQAKKTPYENFIEHVDNCIRFLSRELNERFPYRGITELELSGYKAVKLVQDENIDRRNAWVLGCKTSKPLPFLYDSPAFSWRILVLSNAGLCLRWEVPEVVKKRMAEGKESTGKTITNFLILSPYVTQLEYVHCDREKKQWEYLTSLDDYFNKFKQSINCGRPDGIRLTFVNNDWQEERFIFLHNDALKQVQVVNKKPLKEKDNGEK